MNHTANKFLLAGVEFIKPCPGPNPEIAGGVLEQAINGIVTEAVGDVGVMEKTFKRFRVPIETIKAALGAYPKRIIPVN